MPFVVGLLQTTLTMTDCTHRLASDPSGSTFPLCVEISSGLIRQSNDYVPVEEHVPGCPHLCSIWREIEPCATPRRFKICGGKQPANGCWVRSECVRWSCPSWRARWYMQFKTLNGTFAEGWLEISDGHGPAHPEQDSASRNQERHKQPSCREVVHFWPIWLILFWSLKFEHEIWCLIHADKRAAEVPAGFDDFRPFDGGQPMTIIWALGSSRIRRLSRKVGRFWSHWGHSSSRIPVPCTILPTPLRTRPSNFPLVAPWKPTLDEDTSWNIFLNRKPSEKPSLKPKTNLLKPGTELLKDFLCVWTLELLYWPHLTNPHLEPREGYPRRKSNQISEENEPLWEAFCLV